MVAWLVLALLVCLTAGLALADVCRARQRWYEDWAAVIEEGGWYSPL
jgi:hypothetical protein